jgi:hypothetical protein
MPALASQNQRGASKPKLRRQLLGDWVELESADGEVRRRAQSTPAYTRCHICKFMLVV